MLPTFTRLPQLIRLINQRRYVVLQSPRQTGKTTALLNLGLELTAAGTYAAVLVSMETGATFSHDPGVAEEAILQSWRRATTARLPRYLHPPPWPDAPTGSRIATALQAWAAECSRPLVLFIDEMDSLQDETLITILQQLREGFPDRPRLFPWSLIMVGHRDIRDYRTSFGNNGHSAGAMTPFTVKTDLLSMHNFTLKDMTEFYQQHTAETGQVFTPDAILRAYELTCGHPWLVNMVARLVVEDIVPDPRHAITTRDIDYARDRLVAQRSIHLDSLTERLRDSRVRHIVEPILAGQTLGNVSSHDIRYVQDLGLCALDPAGGLVVSNPIYREILLRALADTTVASLPHIPTTWFTLDGHFDSDQLLNAFLAFWRDYGYVLLVSAPYEQAAPHIVLMAFLYRVSNSGCSLESSYALGRERLDVCVRYGHTSLAVELKVWAYGNAPPIQEGMEHLDAYLDDVDSAVGWLVVCDQRAYSGDGVQKRDVSVSRGMTPSGRSVAIILG